MSFRSVILQNFSDLSAVRDAIDRYFDEFTGAQFEHIADTDQPNLFTARDIVAVSMLGVNIPATVSVWLLLDEGKQQTSRLLSQVPADLDIWDAAEHISSVKPLWQLWDLLRGQRGIGNMLCSKLLAAKRPRLVPIMDSVIVGVLGRRDEYWRGFSEALSLQEDRLVLEAATAHAPSCVSLLRRIDVVLWMLNREKASRGTGW